MGGTVGSVESWDLLLQLKRSFQNYLEQVEPLNSFYVLESWTLLSLIKKVLIYILGDLEASQAHQWRQVKF